MGGRGNGTSLHPRLGRDDDNDNDNDNDDNGGNPFLSAKDQLRINERKNGTKPTKLSKGSGKKKNSRGSGFGASSSSSSKPSEADVSDERLKNVDPTFVEMIENEIIAHELDVTWDDIAGLASAKKAVMEIVVLPLLRPDLFTGLRSVPKGILMFGPPGTGKTLIGKAIASQSGATFFSISASALTSKWVGQGEKMVRALFAVARVHQPAVIFIDEIDSLLTQRSEKDMESSRRIKTEFLVQLDGCGSGSATEQLLVVGATNRPQEIDEAARRRFTKRLYIPLPDAPGRKQLIHNLLSKQDDHSLSDADVDQLVDATAGYSGADIKVLCTEAALGPIRELTNMTSLASMQAICDISVDSVRPLARPDFDDALRSVRPSVSPDEITHYVQWNELFGSAK